MELTLLSSGDLLRRVNVTCCDKSRCDLFKGNNRHIPAVAKRTVTRVAMRLSTGKRRQTEKKVAFRKLTFSPDIHRGTHLGCITRFRDSWPSSRLFRPKQEEHPSNQTKALALVEAVEATGIEPFEQPERYPKIEKEEVRLVCWLAIHAQPGTS